MSKTSAIQEPAGISRREFLKTSAKGATACAAFFTVLNADALTTGENPPDPVGPATAPDVVVHRYSTCQNCHSRCGLVAEIVGPAGDLTPSAGVLTKLDGNPWNPQNMDEGERLAYSTAPPLSYETRGRLCPKGQAGVQVLYDPYRIKHPLKQVGARGSGQWEQITWAQAFTEIGAKMNALIPPASRLTTPINPLATRLGPIANGVVISPGRLPDGEFNEKIWKNTYGTANYRLDHTSICEVSHHVSNELMTWAGGKKSHFKPDIDKADYLVLFGANYLEANFPMLGLSRKVGEFKKDAGKKLVVVDPRFSNSAAKANDWLPAKPGTDGAVALAMATQIIKAFGPTTMAMGAGDTSPIATYLRNPNAAAATADGQDCWTDATLLVSVAGPSLGGYPPGGPWVWRLGAPALAAGAPDGDLLPGLVPVGGDLCKTVYQMIWDNVIAPYTPDYYADIAGVDAGQVKRIADEFYAARPRAVANPYRGTVQHTNGMWSMMSVALLNALVGNYDHEGGNMLGGGGWSYSYTKGDVAAGAPPFGMNGSAWGGLWGSYAGGIYGAAGPFGPRVDRAKATGTYSYINLNTDNPALFPFPAKRPWGPYWTHGNYQEIVPGIFDQYPYPTKVLITYWNNLPYATPALKNVWLATVQDPAKLPLFVAIDNQMGEASMYADYILPDTTYLERWCFPGGGNVSHPTKYVNLRQPLVGSFDSRSWDAPFDPTAANSYNPIYPDTKLFEEIYLGIVGAGGVGLTMEINGDPLPANTWAHWKPAFTKLVANINAATDPGKPGGGVLTVDDIVARGGAFQDAGNGYNPAGKMRYKYANQIRLYYNELAGVGTDGNNFRDTMGSTAADRWAPPAPVGAPFNGYLAVAHYEPVKDLKGIPVSDAAFPYQLITYKKVLHGQARTQNLPWLTCWQPENYIELNAGDAAALGVENYDRVRLTSASDPTGVEGRVWITQGLRPGVVAVSHHFGHWAQSAAPFSIDDVPQPTAPSRSLGLTANPSMRTDPQFGPGGSLWTQAAVTLQDKIGGSCSFNDTRVNVQKI